MKAIEQYFHVVLFIMLCKVAQTFYVCRWKIVCDHSHESYWAVLSCGTVYYALYNNQINARALIGQSAVGYCYHKPTEKSRVFWIII